MKKALAIQVYNRPDYLEETIHSLLWVRGVEDWHVVFSIDTSDKLGVVQEVLEPFARRLFELGMEYELRINDPKLGVLRHPWALFDSLFRAGFDYVLRTEDDLVLSTDVLEYHAWASETYKDDASVGFVTAFADDYRDHSSVRRHLGLASPLAHGTWADRWTAYYRDTWDFDYSTNSGEPGVHAGWDFNLEERIMPPLNLHTIVPLHTKCFHIGVVGEHSVPEIYFRAPDFDPVVSRQTYKETS